MWNWGNGGVGYQQFGHVLDCVCVCVRMRVVKQSAGPKWGGSNVSVHVLYIYAHYVFTITECMFVCVNAYFGVKQHLRMTGQEWWEMRGCDAGANPASHPLVRDMCWRHAIGYELVVCPLIISARQLVVLHIKYIWDLSRTNINVLNGLWYIWCFTAHSQAINIHFLGDAFTVCKTPLDEGCTWKRVENILANVCVLCWDWMMAYGRRVGHGLP